MWIFQVLNRNFCLLQIEIAPAKASAISILLIMKKRCAVYHHTQDITAKSAMIRQIIENSNTANERIIDVFYSNFIDFAQVKMSSLRES